jgi:hypothetical protein
VKLRIVLVALLLTAAVAAGAQDRGLGAGVIVGEPTGFSAKLWLGAGSAIDAGAAWAFGDPAAFHLHGDYLMHVTLPAEIKKGSLVFYFGGGGRVRLEDETRVGVRIPLGLAYLFAGYPIDLFLEVVPIMDIVPATELAFNAGLGARFFVGGHR